MFRMTEHRVNEESDAKCTTAVARLKQDYIRIKRDPVPYVIAEPLPSNILEWHYVITGPEDTPYEGGYYHGKLLFPREFPFKPPSIYMITPSGRFMTNTKLCLSISDYHPNTWNPAWSVATILTGLLSFMIEETKTLGSLKTTTYQRKVLAYQSLKFNLEDKVFQELFPDLCVALQKILDKRLEAQKIKEEQERERQREKEKELEREREKERERERERQLEKEKEKEKENEGKDDSGQGSSAKTPNGHRPILSTIANIAVIIGFAAFAYAVKYVFKNLNYE